MQKLLETKSKGRVHTSAKARLTSVCRDMHPDPHPDPFGSFCAKLLIDRQTDRQTDIQRRFHILLDGGNKILMITKIFAATLAGRTRGSRWKTGRITTSTSTFSQNTDLR